MEVTSCTWVAYVNHVYQEAPADQENKCSDYEFCDRAGRNVGSPMGAAES